MQQYYLILLDQVTRHEFQICGKQDYFSAIYELIVYSSISYFCSYANKLTG